MESEKARYAESDTDTLLEELANVYEEMLTNKVYIYVSPIVQIVLFMQISYS